MIPRIQQSLFYSFFSYGTSCISKGATKRKYPPTVIARNDVPNKWQVLRHTLTHLHIYMHIPVKVCVCVWVCVLWIQMKVRRRITNQSVSLRPQFVDFNCTKAITFWLAVSRVVGSSRLRWVYEYIIKAREWGVQSRGHRVAGNTR